MGYMLPYALILYYAFPSKVKRAIGSSRVDDNQQLFDEATALAEILGEVRLQTDESIKRRQSVLLQTPRRAVVESCVRMSLDNIQRVVSSYSASTTDPRIAVESLVAKDGKDKSLYQYMSTVQTSLGPGLGLARPATPRTPPSRPISSCEGSRPSTAGTAGSGGSLDTAQIISDVQPKLNAFDIDAITTQIREALKSEHEALMEDVEYLHQCLQVHSNI